MPTKWFFAGVLACGLGWTAFGADEPSKDAKPPEGWVAYVPKDKVFSVWIPKGGKRTERGDWVDVKDIKARVNILDLESNDQGRFIVRTILIQPGPPVPAKGGLQPPIPPVPPIGKGPIPPTPPIKPVPPGKLPPPPIGVPGPPVGGPPPRPVNPIGPELAQALIEVTRDVYVKELKGKIIDENDIKLGDRKGKEYQIQIDTKRSARLRVFAIGTFIHSFAIVGTNEQVKSKDADTFLDSFRITLGEDKPKEKDKEKK
jgi:hypothetical protein